MAAVAEMGFECDMEESGEELLLDDAQVGSGARSRRRVWMATGALLAMCACVATWQHSRVSIQANAGSLIGLSDEEIDTDVKCEHLPHVHLYKVVSSNLAKQGPDTDAPEGIIYKAKAVNVDDDMGEYEIHLHSVKDFEDQSEDNYDDSYRPAFTHGEFVNGLHGKFAGINVKAGENLKFRLHAYNVTAKKDMVFPMGVVTFFDLDNGHNDAVEHVSVRGYQAYYVTKDTELKISHDEDTRFTTFTGTTEGNGDDNPTEPFDLTDKQQNRAVTFEFPAVTEFNVEIGCTYGKTDRVFSFAFRPSLTCDQADVKKVYPYEHLKSQQDNSEKSPPKVGAKDKEQGEKSGSAYTVPSLLAVSAAVSLFA